MSVSSEVQRTLVKSPPELWAELSDPASLARHLGELGEIRITGTDPERLVDWEATSADGAAVSGRVEIEPSGWGTRVTLFASRDLLEQESEQAPEPELAPDTELSAESEPGPESEAAEGAPAVESAPDAEAEAEPEEGTEAEVEIELDAGPEIVEPEPRPGFFARLFRRRKQQPDPEPIASIETEEPAPEPEPEPVTEPEPAPIAILEIEEPAIAEQPDELAPDIAAELADLEEQTTAVLTGVLDRLGAAHHRPFSRA